MGVSSNWGTPKPLGSQAVCGYHRGGNGGKSHRELCGDSASVLGVGMIILTTKYEKPQWIFVWEIFQGGPE